MYCSLRPIYTLLAIGGICVLLSAGCSKKESGTTPSTPSSSSDKKNSSVSELPAQVMPDISDKSTAVQQQIAKAMAELKESPENASANGKAAMLFHLYGFDDAADVYYQRAELLDKEEKKWPYLRAWALTDAENPDNQSIDEFQECIRRDSTYLPAYYQLSNRLYQAGMRDDSKNWSIKLLEVKPDSPAGHYLLARVLFDEDNYEDAVKHLQVVVEPSASNRSSRAAQAHLLLSKAFEKLGNEEAAQRHRIKGASNATIIPPSDPLMIELLNLDRSAGYEIQRAKAAVNQGKSDDAIAILQAALREAPEDGRIVMTLSDLLLRVGKGTDAVQILRDYIANDPSNAIIHSQLGEMLEFQGKPEDAEKEFRKAIELDPDFYPARLNLALLLNKSGKPEDAIELLRALNTRAPDYSEAGVALAQLLYATGKQEEAIEQFKNVIERNPSNATAYNELAGYYLMKGDTDKAIYYLRNAIEANPFNQQPYLLLTDIYFSSGQYGYADETINQAYELCKLISKTQLTSGVALTLNCRAWLWATSPNIVYRNGPEAVRIMKQLCSKPQFRQPVFLDTLSAAYAEVGDFENAVMIQQELLQMFQEVNQEPPAEFIERLSLYEQGKPYRMPREGTGAKKTEEQ